MKKFITSIEKIVFQEKLFGAVLVVSLFFTGCKKDSPHPSTEIIVHSGSSIQAAVNSASPGTTIRIEPGVYAEAINVSTGNITIIGLNGPKHSGVIIRNPGDEENGISVSENGDGFVLKNVTVEGFEENGVYLTGVDGFILSHVTTIDNGEYGLFPVHSKNGLIEECVATGHTDTGIYVGQSSNVVVTHSEAYANVNGIEIENCSDIVAEKNHSYDNVAGMLVILLPGLPVKSSSNILLKGNMVENNNHVNFATPGAGFESVVPSGSGILIVGTDKTVVQENNVTGNHFTGIALVSTVILGSLAGLPPEAFADIEPNPDDTRIIHNTVINNGTVPPPGLPLPAVDLLWDGSGTNNCWSHNTYLTSYPPTLPACN
ncbi:MAG: parallel beta-helix domain-containing protein [Ginsengibacter sp.]